MMSKLACAILCSAMDAYLNEDADLAGAILLRAGWLRNRKQHESIKALRNFGLFTEAHLHDLQSRARGRHD